MQYRREKADFSFKFRDITHKNYDNMKNYLWAQCGGKAYMKESDMSTFFKMII